MNAYALVNPAFSLRLLYEGEKAGIGCNCGGGNAGVIDARNRSDTSTVGWGNIKHVLLLSIDGMHAVDFDNWAHGIAAVNGGDTDPKKLVRDPAAGCSA